ncbi:MAG TPA: zf-HC2 domain-containing protein [Candidatus Acidoferrum sp.]|nr:zf-HC2 domain-containing protein [Candidatus Acidoferrum sp.]
MSGACPGQPVSWLELERYALGELDGAAAADVAGHLAGCAACREAFGTIEADRDRVLPPLPDLVLAAARRRRHSRRALVAGGTLLAAAAALMLYWRDREANQLTAGIKGGDELTLSLVRERQGDIAHDPTGFRPGDRFQVVVTCAHTGAVTVELSVRQGAATDRPLPPASIRCGNRVSFPGAFRITGTEPVSICIAAAGRTRCQLLAPE